MPFDDDKPEDPIEGLGDEILPSRGMPFDDVGEVENEDNRFGLPRDVSPDELADLFDRAAEAGLVKPKGHWLETDSGMGASEPVLRDSDFEAMDLPPAGSGGIASEPVPLPIPAPGAEPPVATDADLTALFITRERLSHLWTRIDTAQQDVREKVPNLPIARDLIAKLEKARNLLLTGMENYEEAERAASEVELRIAVIERSQADNRSVVGLFLYQMVWVITLVIFFVVVGDQELTDQMLLLQSAAWGGIGGIAGALYALWKHVSRDLDFTRQYSLWYITHPIMGLVLGAFVFLVTRFGILSLFTDAESLEISSPFVIYILAFVVGYQQNVAWDLMRRVLKVFQLGEDSRGS
jgi:hypothetical protein